MKFSVKCRDNPLKVLNKERSADTMNKYYSRTECCKVKSDNQTIELKGEC